MSHSIRLKPTHAAVLALVCLCLTESNAQTALPANQLPSGAKLVGGNASVSTSGNTLNVNQTSNRAAIEWNQFNVGSDARVNFNQPSASSVTLNRVVGGDPSQIMGRINATGQVFLVNPGGVIFGPKSQVDVGGLVVTTMGISNDDFMSGKTSFAGTGSPASVVNQGTLQAAIGGFVALLAPEVRNEGIIIAQQGSVALAAGNKATLVFSGSSLTTVEVDQGILNALVENKHMLIADGGLVLMTARSANALMSSLVKNSGTVQAQTISNQNGRILLMGDMTSGTTLVDGKLDASAPNGGDGGFIETSAAKVKVSDSADITAFSSYGKSGSYLIDPTDFVVAFKNGDLSNTRLQRTLETANVTIQNYSDYSTVTSRLIPTSGSTDSVLPISGVSSGLGNIYINSGINWSTNTTLTLKAINNVYINANIIATGAAASLVVTHGASGSMKLQNGKYITLSGENSYLSIGENIYKIINSLDSLASTTSTGYYALGRDIDASATSGWNDGKGFIPIGVDSYFSGVFNGLGHTIDGLTIKSNSNTDVGLFARLTDNARVSNVGLINSNIESTTVNTKYIGGIAGQNAGTIDQSYITGSISKTVSSSEGIGGLVGKNDSTGTVSNSYSTARVTGGVSTKAIGGLIGTSLGTVSSSYASGNVTAGEKSGGDGVIESGGGGLIGYATGTISDSYATGAVNVTGPAYSFGGLIGFANVANISSSYATGNVTVTSGNGTSIGGLLGSGSNVTVNKSYASGNVSLSSRTGTATKLGGFSGELLGVTTVNNSYATGSVSVAGTSANVGGFTGVNGLGSTLNYTYSSGAVSSTFEQVGGFLGSNNGNINNSFWNTTTSGITTNPRITGLSGLTTTQMQSTSSLAGAGWDPAVWSASSSGSPELKASTLYIRPVTGVSAYGIKPGVTYAVYDSSGNLVIGYPLTGTAALSITKGGSALTDTALSSSSSAGIYKLTYVSGLSVLGSTLSLNADSTSVTWGITPTITSPSSTASVANNTVDPGASKNLQINNNSNIISYKAPAPDEWLNRKNTVVNTLTEKDIKGIRYMNAEQITNLSPQQLSVVNPSQIKGLSTAQLVNLSAEQLKALSGNQLANLSTSQIEAFSDAQLSFLSPNQWSSLTENQIPALTTVQLNVMPTKAFTQLRETQLQSLTPAQLNSLSTDVFLVLNKNQLGCLTCNQLKSLKPQQVASLPLGVFKYLVKKKTDCMSAAQLAALSPEQLQYLMKNTLPELNREQWQALNTKKIPPLPQAQLQKISQQQVQFLQPEQLTSLSDAFIRSTLKTMTTQQIQALLPEQFSNIQFAELAALKPLQIQAITPQQISQLSPEVIAQLGKNQWRDLLPSQIQQLQSVQLKRLTPEQINLLTLNQVSALGKEQLAALLPAQLASFSPKQLQALLPEQLALLKPEQIQAFNNPLLLPKPKTTADTLIDKDFQQLTSDQFTAQNIPVLIPQQIRLLTPQQVSGLNKTQLANLSPSQWQLLSPEQISAISADTLKTLDVGVLKNLNPAQLSALTNLQWQNLTPTQLQVIPATTLSKLKPEQLRMLNSQQLNALDKEQVAALSPQQLIGLSPQQWTMLTPLQLQKLNPAQVAGLLPEQLNQLNDAQIKGLSAEQLKSLQPAQLMGLNPKLLNALNPQQWQTLTPAQISTVTPEQISGLKPAQLLSLTESQLALMSSAQINAFTADQFKALLPAQINAISPITFVNIRPGHLQNLGINQFTALTPQSIAVMGIPQIQSLTIIQMANMSPPQIGALSTNQLQSLTPLQLNAIPPRLLWSLSNQQLQSFTPEQVSQLTGAQLSSLVTLLNPQQLAGLNNNQLASIDNSQTRALLNNKPLSPPPAPLPPRPQREPGNQALTSPP